MALGMVLMLAACAQGHRPSMSIDAAQATLLKGDPAQRREAALSLGRWAQEEKIEEAALRGMLPALAQSAAKDGEGPAGAAVWAWSKAVRASVQYKLCENSGDVAGVKVLKEALFRSSLADVTAAALALYPECGMEAAKALMTTMEQARNPMVKREAAKALGVILPLDVPEEVVDFVVPRLDAAQSWEDAELRLLAAQARVALEIGLAPRADMAEQDKIEEVWQLADQANEDVLLRAAAVRVLAQLEMVAPADALAQAAQDALPEIRLAAIDGMARNAEAWEQVLPVLRRLAVEDDSPLVRRRAQEAIIALIPAAERNFSAQPEVSVR